MVRNLSIATAVAFLALQARAQAPAGAAPVISLSAVHKIFIEKMDGNLDQYLRVEIMKQAKGHITVALDRAEADAVLTGSNEQKTGVGHAITGRYLGLEDNTTAALSLTDVSGKNLLWAAEAGDRSLLFSVMRRGGERKVADRIVGKLLKALRP